MKIHLSVGGEIYSLSGMELSHILVCVSLKSFIIIGSIIVKLKLKPQLNSNSAF